MEGTPYSTCNFKFQVSDQLDDRGEARQDGRPRGQPVRRGGLHGGQACPGEWRGERSEAARHHRRQLPWCVQGALDQLGAARRRPLHPGFLLGLLLKVRAFGLVLAKPELRGDEVHRNQLVVPQPAARKLVSIISPLSKSALLLFVPLKPHNDDQDVLAIEAPPSARRLFFHEQSSLHRKYLDNFDFIFGLHINLFRSLAYRLISIGTINAF